MFSTLQFILPVFEDNIFFMLFIIRKILAIREINVISPILKDECVGARVRSWQRWGEGWLSSGFFFGHPWSLLTPGLNGLSPGANKTARHLDARCDRHKKISPQWILREGSEVLLISRLKSQYKQPFSWTRGISIHQGVPFHNIRSPQHQEDGCTQKEEGHPGWPSNAKSHSTSCMEQIKGDFRVNNRITFTFRAFAD